MKNYILILLLVPFFAFSNSNAINNKIYKGNTITTTKSLDHKIWNDLLQKYVSKKGNVNYSGFKKDEAKLDLYLNSLSKNSPENNWSKNAVLAYWINAYNAFTVKLILDNYPLKSIKDIKKPWDLKFIVLADKTYSLGDIEHKILRKMNEPRIHFAINCASYSCPNLLNKAYTAGALEKQLESVSKSFINDGSKNYITTNSIEISEIFNWFSKDFKTKGSLIDFLNRYSAIKINENAKIKYKNYNWNLNK